MASSSAASRIKRAVVASPFLYLAWLCFTEMDRHKLQAHQEPALSSRKIEWGGVSIPILWDFHHVPFLDEIFRGITVTFSPSALGFDAVSSWHMFNFLTDLGPIYALWLLESTRGANAWTPAYFATSWSTLAQLVGIGTIAPLFYYLAIVFGPTASDLTGPRSKSSSNRLLRPEYYTPLLLPLILAFHNAEIFAAYLSPGLETRHYWVWAWQLAPLWIGIANVVLAKTLVPLVTSSASLKRASPTTLLAGVSLVSAGVWAYTLVYSPYPLKEIFLSGVYQRETEFLPHTRRALQFDQLCSVGAHFLWLAYSIGDLVLAGKVGGGELFWPVALAPVVAAAAGPGSALAFIWSWREARLDQSL
ncbi:hypothetical protein B0T17DRAFT_518678 [Bombardia bombarda]|uniref:Uncharacterized protein n=1 Tax=Bombardia bombarda TaxID=252184 RepID=A0AA39XMB9_9PEZI|nr:hypothetical protein B0T17DRAFT_518678 [Bombardia bombarda]